MAWGTKVVNSSDIRNGWIKTLDRLIGTKGTGNGTGVSVAESAGKTILTFTNVVIPTTDAGAAGAQGSLKIYDFPEGLLDYRGGVFSLTVTGAAGIAATSTVIASVGTTAAAADLTLSGTEADLIPSGSVVLVASTGTVSQVSGTSQVAISDGTATAKDAFLNLVVDATGSTANSTLTVNGTVTLAWSLIGDK